ncbi:MAG: PAS domain S-box protein [Methanoregula sp.]|nr:PAS domain S-box protein [Methanoregula sp.]
MALPIQLLYVDDEPVLLEIGKLFLEAKGEFCVDTLTSAKEALSLLNTKRYDAIIADYQMPEMDGITFLKQLKTTGDETPFIIFTGRGREEIVIQALNEGADFYLQKGGEPKPQFAELAHKIHLAVQQRRAAASIRNHERREADIINFLPDATFAIDTQGIMIAWNRAMEKMTGILSDQILGKGNYEYSIPFYQERRPILIDLVLKEDPVSWGKYPAITRDGTTLFSEITIPHFNKVREASFWFTASPLFDMQGTIIGAIESIREITERKQSEEIIARSRERLKRAEQVSGSGHWEFNLETREVITSEGARSIYGLPDGHVSVLEVQQVPLSECRPMLDEALRSLIEDNQRYDVEFRIKRPNDGRILDIHSIAEYDPTRRVVFGVLQDITGRKRAEQRLSEINRAFLSFSPDPLNNITILTGLAGTILQGTCALYNRLENGLLKSLGMWNAPPDFNACDQPEGHICNDVIRHGDSVPTIITNLQESSYAETDPNVKRYQLQTYIGIPVKTWGNYLGSLCVVYQKNYSPTPQDLEVLSFLAKAIAIEEERRSTLQEIQDSEENFRTILNSMQSGIVIIDAHTHQILDVNPKALDMIGGARESVIDSVCHRFICPAESGKCPVTDLGQTIDSSERVLLTRNKERKSIYKSVIKTVMGGKEVLIESFIDFTERKQVEDILRENEQKFRSLVEYALEGIFIVDFQGTILFANKAAARTIESEGTDWLLGRNVMEFIAPESRQAVMSDFVQVAQGHDAYLAHYHAISAKGKQISIESIGKVITYEGKTADLISIRDVTEKTSAEEALRASEEKYRLLIENSHDIIYTLTNEGIFSFVSPSWTLLLGHPVTEVIGRSFKDFAHPDDIPQCLDFLQKTISEGIRQPDVEYRVQHADGSWRWHVSKSVPLRDAAGTVIGFEGIASDITARKRAEEALRQANKKLNLLSGITRHDIKNQLLALDGFLELFHEKNPDPDNEHFFKRIMEAKTQIASMIEFTREYEKIGITDPVWQDCHILVDTVSTGAPLGKVLVKNEIPAGTEVFADPLIAKVFYNLMDNAVRYGEKITTLRFSVQELDSNHLILCEDDGCGIPANEKVRIFKRGYGKNTGLGLSLSREILDITGITIHETGEPGRGARFEIAVPANNYHRRTPATERKENTR